MRLRLLWLVTGFVFAALLILVVGDRLGAGLIQLGLRLETAGSTQLYTVALVPRLADDAALRRQVAELVDGVATERVAALIGRDALTKK